MESRKKTDLSVSGWTFNKDFNWGNKINFEESLENKTCKQLLPYKNITLIDKSNKVMKYMLPRGYTLASV